jgi:SAM-dependent methyltransferase
MGRQDLDDILSKMPEDLARAEGWDREWIRVFCTGYGRLYFADSRDLSVVAELAGKSPSETYSLQLCLEQLPLWTWMEGDRIVGKNILEIGCGPGMLLKQLSFEAPMCLGLDCSPLAIHIARMTSAPNCTYALLGESDAIAPHLGTIDTMVSRFFFIHQDYENARWILSLARLLLKQGGLIGADFFLVNPRVSQGAVSKAKSRAPKGEVTSAYEFSVKEIGELAKEAGLTVADITDRQDVQRRFVFFQRP